MTSDIDDEMKRALARYSGPVTRCHPGNARGKRVKVKPPVQGRPVNVGHERRHLKADDVARWLTQHDEDALSAEHQRARRRKEREERVQSIPFLSLLLMFTTIILAHVHTLMSQKGLAITPSTIFVGALGIGLAPLAYLGRVSFCPTQNQPAKRQYISTRAALNNTSCQLYCRLSQFRSSRR
jgi:hypothetical protein